MVEISIEAPDYDLKKDYFDEIFSLSFQNQALDEEIESLTNELQQIWKQVQKYEKKVHGRKTRRRNKDLKKFFTCPNSACSKKYAHNSSLLLHIRLKHSNA